MGVAPGAASGDLDHLGHAMPYLDRVADLFAEQQARQRRNTSKLTAPA
jgi:hypothetical protein